MTSKRAVAAALKILRAVARQDPDRAQLANDRGFSKADARLGHRLAAMHPETVCRNAGLAAEAVRLAARYRRQAPAGLTAMPDLAIRILDLPEAVDRISQLERERDEAIARADAAEYTRDALAERCKRLEEKLETVEVSILAGGKSVNGRFLKADADKLLDDLAGLSRKDPSQEASQR